MRDVVEEGAKTYPRRANYLLIWVDGPRDPDRHLENNQSWKTQATKKQLPMLMYEAYRCLPRSFLVNGKDGPFLRFYA